MRQSVNALPVGGSQVATDVAVTWTDGMTAISTLLIAVVAIVVGVGEVWRWKRDRSRAEELRKSQEETEAFRRAAELQRDAEQRAIEQRRRAALLSCEWDDVDATRVTLRNRAPSSFTDVLLWALQFAHDGEVHLDGFDLASHQARVTLAWLDGTQRVAPEGAPPDSRATGSEGFRIAEMGPTLLTAGQHVSESIGWPGKEVYAWRLTFRDDEGQSWKQDGLGKEPRGLPERIGPPVAERKVH